MALWRHRRRLTLMALGLSGLLALVGWWQATGLSPFEREIVGEWAIPQAEVAPRAGFVTASGPVTNPWMVWDFRRDRSLRVRIVSPDDPSVNIPQIEGRWRVSDGELSLDDLGAWAWVVREARERFGRSFGVPSTSRISARPRHRIRLSDRDTLEMGVPQRKAITLKRLSTFALPKSPDPHAAVGESTAGQAPDR